MIKGRKHVWCGRINWEGKDLCSMCKPWGPVPKEMYHFTDVIFDNPKIEELAAKAKKMAEGLGMKIEIEYDVEHENEHGEAVGCMTINGWITLYPEKINKIGLGQEIHTLDGWAIDVTVYYSGSSVEPPSEDYSRVGVFEHWLTALTESFEMIFKEHLNNVAEGMQFEEQAEKDLPF